MTGKAPIKQQITSLPIAEIEVAVRLRPISDTAVETLIHSIGDLDHILHPLQVQKIKGGYRLLDGMHRLAAAKALGMTEVPVSVFTCSNHQAMKIEVEGNLAGAPLNPLDMALFLATQKDLYEAEFPEAKLAAAANSARRGDCTDKMAIQSFAANAADALGKSDRTVRRLIAAAKGVDQAEIDRLRTLPRRVTISDLEALGKEQDAQARRTACAALADGKAKTIAKAIKAYHAEPGSGVLSDADKHATALANAWARASAAGKQRFLADHYDELVQLLDKIEVGPADIVPFVRKSGGIDA